MRSPGRAARRARRTRRPRATSAGGQRRFLDLLRADAVAGALDHRVAPADEIEQPVRVALHPVARPHRGAAIARGGGRRAEPLGGPRGVAANSLARPAGRNGPVRPPRPARRRSPSSPIDQDLGERDRLADRGRDARRPARDRDRSSGRLRSGRTSGTAAPAGTARASSRTSSAVKRAAAVGQARAGWRHRLAGQSCSTSWSHSGGTAASVVTP